MEEGQSLPGGTPCSCPQLQLMLDELFERLAGVCRQAHAEAPKTRKKRAPSAYNLFIGQCMKQPGKDMRTCAKEYKAQKG